MSVISGAIIPRATGTGTILRRPITVKLIRLAVPATFYSPNGAVGACGVAIQNSNFSVALNTADFKNGASCGEDIVVSANGKSITASVQDVCADCASGSIGLTSSAFEALTGSNSAKPVEIVWFFVPEF
ncbi:hypothetical protein DFH07DRAFT_740916 [Mycena maculata]|uniref:RlpA-like protein double-psi beta-barrel domain-containing protein n=1 Tax=Mycena maculata TaxID=230809 RepID=A0AAD7JBB7_9AGAR|nr:hypothetical protein DFH07DRAFT_740916 [Mycena maculata]